MLRTAELDFELPERLIATRPCEPRDAARLMVLRRSDPAFVLHTQVRELPGLLCAGDLLVFNRTTVVPARLSGRRRATGGRIGGLFVRELDVAEEWAVLLQSGGRLASGDVIDLDDGAGAPTGVALRLLAREGEEWSTRLEGAAGASARTILERVGATPLPPYILRARKLAGDTAPDALDRAWYQTVYADPASGGSVAAPTAGLHFTPGLLDRLRGEGVREAFVSLRVGLGTFKPVTAQTIEEHDMHAEWFDAPAATLRAIEAAARGGGRTIAVGTTSARALESAPASCNLSAGASGWTRLLVTPGHAWRRVDGLMTNFHLPRSTLLALVSALLPEGPARLLAAYREAVRLEYRFYSYGDAMLILP